MVMLYIRCQRSVPVHKVVCLLRKEMESKGMQVGVVDEHVVHQTFTQKAGACVPLDQACN